MKKAMLAVGVASFAWVCAAAFAADFVLVERGVAKAPIVVAEGAPPATMQAAGELAEYIEKISGARPKVLTGRTVPMPASAVWVGFQEGVDGIFPAADFELRNPEEILLLCDGQHVAITGRDIMANGEQTKFGTANAVYTFLQDQLGVRWLWPGPLGEDIVKRETISFAPFEYRFHPVFRQRGDVFRLSRAGDQRGMAQDWARFQRVQLDSLVVPGGHGFTRWWDMYHETNPEYFALQPDGTRSGFPAPRTAKLCQSNPEVWAQWLENAVEELREAPSKKVINSSPNDSHSSGICVCPNCRAWDNPQAVEWRYRYEGATELHVAMTDRYVTFWNHLARLLKERLPEREAYVGGMAYGPSTPPPVAAALEENVIIGYVGHFPVTTESARQQQKEEWKAWAEKASKLAYRPNLWYWAGGVWGLPEVAMTKTIEDFRFLAENSCVGIFVDTTWEHWATQAPQYYIMGQLAWNPTQDGRAVLEDYYRRGFGPAAEDVAAYWSLMEKARDGVVGAPNFGLGSRNRYRVVESLDLVFNGGVLAEAGAALDRAEAKLADGPQVYRDRLAFIHAGFEFTRLILENIPVMTRVRESEGKDVEAVRQAVATWQEIERVCTEAGPIAFRYDRIVAKLGPGYMGHMADHLGPPSDAVIEAAGLK